jgi:hypothetical protein
LGFLTAVMVGMIAAGVVHEKKRDPGTELAIWGL